MGWWLKRIFLLVTFTLIIGCKPHDGYVIKVGANNWLGYQPFFSAQALGYWDTEKLNVIELGSATEVMRAFRNEAIDVAAVTLDEAITLLQHKPNSKVVMVVDYSFGGDALIVKPELQTLADIKGKTIAVENTALGALMLNVILEKAQLTLKDVTLVSATFAQHQEVLDNNEADAVITFNPVRSRLLEKGYKSLFDSREIPGKIVDVIVVSDYALSQYPDRIQKLITGFYKAHHLIQNQDNSLINSIVERVGINRESVLMGFQEVKIPDLQSNKVLMSQCQEGLAETSLELLSIMRKRKIINFSVDLNHLCEPDVIAGVNL